MKDTKITLRPTPSHLPTDGSVPATTTRVGLPFAEIALGIPAINPEATDAFEFEFPRTQSVLQQLHNYPVGSTGKSRAASCFGSKYNITPVRREFLSDIRVVVALRGNLNLEQLVERGLKGELNQDRYGVPFLGDNSFLLDRLEITPKPMPCRWFERVSDYDCGIREHATRLTEMVDRTDPSHTKTGLYAPSLQHMFEPTEQSWVRFAPIKQLP